jgi:hypothetical protein
VAKKPSFLDQLYMGDAPEDLAVRPAKGGKRDFKTRVPVLSGGTTLGEMGSVLGSALRRAPKGVAPVASVLGGMGKFLGKQALLSVQDRVLGGNAAYQHITDSPGLQAWSKHAVEHPVNEMLNLVPLVGDVKSVGEMMKEAVQARRRGDIDTAEQYEAMLLPGAAAGLIPEAGAVMLRGVKGALKPAARGFRQGGLAVKKGTR